MFPWILGCIEIGQIQQESDFLPAQPLDAEQVAVGKGGHFT